MAVLFQQHYDTNAVMESRLQTFPESCRVCSYISVRDLCRQVTDNSTVGEIGRNRDRLVLTLNNYYKGFKNREESNLNYNQIQQIMTTSIEIKELSKETDELLRNCFKGKQI